MKQLLQETPLLNYNHPQIQSLIQNRGWKTLKPAEQLQEIYLFVRDEILFGYNEDDRITASQVLTDGYGQCNTKSTLFMALLRAVGIPNRIHGFTIDKALQKGAITGIWYRLSPKNILHSWVEVKLDENWYFLEGIILDKTYLTALQQSFPECEGTFCGYGAYTDSFSNPAIDWNYNHTFIQKKGINQDFGLFDSPDDFYNKHQQQLNLLKKWLFKRFIRHFMNKNVATIRKQYSGIPA